MSDVWVRTYENGLEYVEALDGIDWMDAPLPRRWHRCKAQLRGSFRDWEFTYRCACGAVSFDQWHWMERNSRRKR